MNAWAVMWRQVKNGVEQQTLLGDYSLLFATRAKARQYIAREYGYIRHRQDLRRAPHGWRMPQPVRVRIVLDADSSCGECARLEALCCELRRLASGTLGTITNQDGETFAEYVESVIDRVLRHNEGD